MNETQFQNLLMGHSEFSRGNVLEINLSDTTAPPQYDDISHDLDISYDLGTDRNVTESHEIVRTTSDLHDIFQDLPELNGIDQNLTEPSGVSRNVPEHLES